MKETKEYTFLHKHCCNSKVYVTSIRTYNT